jgi:hypothetical protein
MGGMSVLLVLLFVCAVLGLCLPLVSAEKVSAEPWYDRPVDIEYERMLPGNMVEQKHANAIVMLMCYKDVRAVDTEITAVVSAAEMHRQFNTSADIVVMAYGRGGQELSNAQEAFLEQHGVVLMYMDLSPLSDNLPSDREYSFRRVIMYGKWFVWTLDTYSRVLFHDLDVQPRGNFDHYFKMPLGEDGGFFVGGGNAPINGGFFLVQPKWKNFKMMMDRSVNAVKVGNVGPARKQNNEQWSLAMGWGVRQQEIVDAGNHNGWMFVAANYDQGVVWCSVV